MRTIVKIELDCDYRWISIEPLWDQVLCNAMEGMFDVFDDIGDMYSVRVGRYFNAYPYRGDCLFLIKANKYGPINRLDLCTTSGLLDVDVQDQLTNMSDVMQAINSGTLRIK